MHIKFIAIQLLLAANAIKISGIIEDIFNEHYKPQMLQQ